MEKNASRILVDKENSVGYISLNKAPANGYETGLLNQLAEAIRSAEADESTKVIVLQSQLEKFFCGGADIKVFARNTVRENKEMVKAARRVSEAISKSKKIFIAALNGHTLGGGLELAMACDLRLAGNKAFLIGLPEIKLGLIPGNGGTVRLIHLIGAGRAMDLLLSGDPISPRQAYEWGLINRIFPEENFNEAVKAFAEQLATGPAQAQASIKYVVHQSAGMNLQGGLELEAQLVDQLYHTPDAGEGFRAFVEKRPANFR